MSMKPINARRRTGQFFRFLLLFLLAVAPITAFMYLYGRVDHVENEYLRSAYQSRREIGSVDQDRQVLLNGVIQYATELNDLLTAKSNDMATLKEGTNKSGEIDGTLTKLDNALINLRRGLGNTAADSLHFPFADLATAYHGSAKRFNDVYLKSFEQSQSLQAKLNEANESLRKFKSALTKCNGKLDREDRVDPDLE